MLASRPDAVRAMTLPLKASVIALAAMLALGACSRSPNPIQAAVAAAPAPAAAMPDRWLGRWQGPEGTFLEVAGAPGAYQVTVQNLDGPRSFEAVGAADGISFVRDGITETIHAGSGAETGMKWLVDKKDCLVVKAGEGYCRD